MTAKNTYYAVLELKMHDVLTFETVFGAKNLL